MRKLVAITIGILVGNLIFFCIAMVANWINPTPPELMDPSTAEAVAERVAQTTTYAWFTTIFGLAIGSFIGGVLGAKIENKHSLGTSIIIGLVFSLWAFYTFYIVYPKVLWVPFIMLFTALYCSYRGGKILWKPTTS